MLHTGKKRVRKAALIGLAGALVVSVSACAESDRGDSGSGESGGTLVFGAAGKPKNFDPIFNDDGETFRIQRQMYDTLITYKPGTAELEPGLATEWEPSNEGKTWTFTLREDVKFHDGTDFNAEAVCANFDRWHNLPSAAAQSQAIYYGDVFGGFAENKGDATGEPLYKSCEADGENTAVVNLGKAKGAFPDAFGLTSFSISSPTAMEKHNADEVTQTGGAFSYSDYANKFPTGTGPFKFESYKPQNNTVTLVRNDDYWGEKAKLDKVVFKIIEDENARKQELEAGSIQAYDFPSPAHYQSLEDNGQKILSRPNFNILYLGINQEGNPKLKDVRVRQAIQYAINKKQLAQNQLPRGATGRDQFLPDTLDGFTKDVEKFPYSQEDAKRLLKEAGAENLTLKFYVPTEVSRPYLPNPQAVGGAIADDLEKVGIKVETVLRPWNGGFKDDVQKLGKQDIHLLGWTGDYGDAGNFIGTFFGREKAEFGFNNPEIFDALSRADATVDDAEQKKDYEEAAQKIAEFIPAVPLTSSPAALAVSPKVHGIVPSPLTDERFSTVTVEES
ncbi:peptide/nickel transport system substrate-binding protein [Tamaricihabitans halophyticus]|uniref:Peptide/nickel transport system substrate-binding protein n=1 Tax=Tamaricihabitans halophyticus TaxID=1262583 RepID=A0A4R2QYE6_9PSEU|nr:ABC transporter substrate-binding protein [Tamaricihabitans halophyticus]TCP54219.1 peptide/nickel transport system substrate-binding protein [Tamaricihabitans halophyticus]